MNDLVWPPLSAPLMLSRDVVHVVRLNLGVPPSQIESLRSVLSHDELARADRFKFVEPRRRFIACRAALRQLLGGFLGQAATEIEFTYGLHGKPLLATSGAMVEATTQPGRSSLGLPLEFSVSHSADLALIAVCGGRRVGVDLEHHDAKVRIHKLATRFFSPREAAELASLPAADQLAGFYRGWTSKEAYLKATGFGLSFPLNQFIVAMNPHEPARLLQVVEQPNRSDLGNETFRWTMHSLDVADQFSAALLIEATAPENVLIHPWSLPHQPEA